MILAKRFYLGIAGSEFRPKHGGAQISKGFSCVYWRIFVAGTAILCRNMSAPCWLWFQFRAPLFFLRLGLFWFHTAVQLTIHSSDTICPQASAITDTQDKLVTTKSSTQLRLTHRRVDSGCSQQLFVHYKSFFAGRIFRPAVKSTEHKHWAISCRVTELLVAQLLVWVAGSQVK